MNKPEPRLPGSAPDSTWGFSEGPANLPIVGRQDFIFPIISSNPLDENEPPRFVGTGFYITDNGLFVTARHLVEDMIDPSSHAQHRAASITHFMPDGKSFYMRPVTQFFTSRNTDLALGIAHQLTHNVTGESLTHGRLALTFNPLAIGDRVSTYAFPDTITTEADGKTKFDMLPAMYNGTIVEFFPKKRDSFRLNFPVYQTDMHLHGGSSGGPVFNAAGHVVGVNCSSLEPITDCSYIVPVTEIPNMWVMAQVEVGAPVRRVLLAELIQRGWVKTF